MSRTKNLIPLLLSIFLFLNPFLVIRAFQNPYEFPKFIFVLVTAQILALLLFLGKKRLRLDLLTKLIFINLIVVLTANILGLDLRTSLIGSTWRHQGFLLLLSGVIFYLASRFINNKKELEKPIIMSSILLSGVTIFQFVLLSFGASLPTYNGRVVATMGNPDFLGAYLVMTLPFILFAKLKQNSFKPILTIFISISVLITQSRSAFLALFTVTACYLINKLKINVYFKLLLAFVSISIILLLISKTSLYQRASIWDSRTLIWNEGIEKMLVKPILGFGQENFELVFPKELNFKVDNAHNLFLETMISSGLIGLIFLISIIIVAFKNADFKYKLSLIAFLITSFFNPLFISGIILFWILIGISQRKS